MEIGGKKVMEGRRLGDEILGGIWGSLGLRGGWWRVGLRLSGIGKRWWGGW